MTKQINSCYPLVKEVSATLFKPKITVNFPYLIILFYFGTKFQSTYKISLKEKKKKFI